MKKARLLWIAAAVLTVLFCVKTAVDWHTYTTTLNSAPFRVWVLMNGVYFLLPAGALAVIGGIVNKKGSER